MSKGDYVEVTVNLGGKTEKIKVMARTNGASVEVQSQAREPHFKVEELNKNKEAVRTFLFSKEAVLVIEESR